jgi:nucleoid-associated protein
MSIPYRLIAHQIIKVQHEPEVSLNLREKLLPTGTDKADSLLDQMRKAITRSNPQAAKFKMEAGTKPRFYQRIGTYLSSSASEKSFVKFSRDATEMLSRQMAHESASTGGYVVCAEHTHSNENYILIVLLSTHAEPFFDDELNLQSALTLDFEHLRHGARIRTEGVEGNEDGVVHFVSRSGRGVSDYFQYFLGCEPLVNSKEQGRFLLSAVRAAADKFGLDRQETYTKTYGYWSDCKRQDRPMTVTGLSSVLMPDDPDRMLHQLGDPAHGLAGEFSPPPADVMKHFKKFEVSAAGLKIVADRELWIDNIKIKGDTILIQHAPKELIESIEMEKA